MTQEITTTDRTPISKTNAPVIEIKDLYKSFGKNEVLKGVTLTVNKGENLVVLGKSGSGKSITIKCLVGLVKVDKGEINVFGTDITKLDNTELNKIRIRIGFLFQNAALYDSMSVRENLGFTLKRHAKDLSAEELENQIIEV
jgi:phospholipid/cholesterol/gamma-HCH transport system ATP-binding protein